jgi:hypothetical protein
VSVRPQSRGSGFALRTISESCGVPFHRGQYFEGTSAITTGFRGTSRYPSSPLRVASAPCTRLLRHPVLHAVNHQMERDLQGFRDRPNSDRSRIQDPSLNAAQVRAFKTALRAQPLLGKARRPAELGHDCAEGPLLEVSRLNMSGARLHREASWWYIEAHKPTAYRPHLRRIGVLSASATSPGRSGRSLFPRYAAPISNRKGG